MESSVKALKKALAKETEPAKVKELQEKISKLENHKTIKK